MSKLNNRKIHNLAFVYFITITNITSNESYFTLIKQVSCLLQPFSIISFNASIKFVSDFC